MLALPAVRRRSGALRRAAGDAAGAGWRRPSRASTASSRCGRRASTPRSSSTARSTSRRGSRPSQLVGFSRYAPVDGGAAERATEVLVWYSPTAMHFGVRASAPPGTVRATLADRDRIDADDHVQFFLSTFADGRQAFVFGVNPFGVQMDGAWSRACAPAAAASAASPRAARTSTAAPTSSSSRAAAWYAGGYEVEVRIPFKSLRYQSGAEQSWGLHVTRVSPGAGVEDSWAPARRQGASFLAQAGLARRAARPAARPGARSQPGRDRAGRRRERRRRRALGLRRLAARLRLQRALGRDPDPDAERDGEPRLLAGRVRRRAVPVRSARRRCSSPRSGRSSSTASSSSPRPTT